MPRAPGQTKFAHRQGAGAHWVVGAVLGLLATGGPGPTPPLAGAQLAPALTDRGSTDRAGTAPGPVAGFRNGSAALPPSAQARSAFESESASKLQTDTPSVGNPQLRDALGRPQPWQGLWGDVSWRVVVFVGAECPLVRQYVPTLNELADTFGSRGVGFLAIDSNSQDSLVDLGSLARETQLHLPLVKDVDGVMADRLAAERTPEVVVLDRNGQTHYRGLIDDRFGVGYARPKATRKFLAEALEQLLAGKSPEVAERPAVGCRIGRLRTPDSHSAVTWSNQVASLLQRRCQACHRPGQIAPFSLCEYDEVRGWAETIAEATAQRRMPPWNASPSYGHFANDVSLSEDEIALLAQWAAAGAPAGDLSRAPAPPPWNDTWQLGQPDQVVYISEAPVEVPATGTIPYQWFEVDPGFKEDTWVISAECLPGNRAVVHHVAVYVWPPGKDWYLSLNDRINLLGLFEPGQRPPDLGWDETAYYIPAGSRLRFEMHYTANGTPQTDRSCVGLRFARPGTVRRQRTALMVAQPKLAIPPHADHYRVEARYTLDEDSLIYSLGPHMHLRGKAFRIEAVDPGGAREILLDVPRYDFAWRLEYQLAQPKRLAKGTEICCTAWFDNSENNPANPDPDATVRWGEQIWEEMMIGGVWLAPAAQDLIAGTGPGPRIIGRRHHWRAWAVSVSLLLLGAAGWALFRRLRWPAAAH